ncbi:MAG: hypothetical protein EOP85_14530, partial [Verrucomicrobiaceae bacterium]
MSKLLQAPLKKAESVILDVALSLDQEDLREAFVSRVYRADPAGLDKMRRLIADAGPGKALPSDTRAKTPRTLQG